ncbi:MAG: cytochrome C oxidase subunit I [Betaproteobacteria bacterium]|nr:cytochrome C oxidase subunit I [Betaproteobacteria bacterium]
MNTATANTSGAKLAFQSYAGTGVLVFLLMMLAGAVLRMAQGTWLGIPANVFYQIMTLHGAGMVGTAGLAGAAVMWYFLRKYVKLSTGIFVTMLVLSLIGVVMILAAILIGGFAAGWTFLFPLPAKSNGMWSAHAAAGYIGGLLFIGVGFLLFYLDCAIAIIKRHGSLVKGLGLDQLFSGRIDTEHPPTVVASTMVAIINILGILAGAVVLVICLVNLYVPSFALDALLVKNMIFFFGHVFINATIYMAVIGVYEIVPAYTGRPWKISRPFLAAWAAVTLVVLAVYPHHTLMDFVMPPWALVLGQVLSYVSGIPVLLVTTWGLLANIHRSGVKWDLPLRLLVFSVLGWSIVVIPAIVDATIRVNLVMHNTLWVPGHFHLYLLLGLLPMLLGTLFYATTRNNWQESRADQAMFWVYGVAGLVFCMMFLAGGVQSTPRRFAEHATEWVPYAKTGAAAAILVVISALHLGAKLLRRLPHAVL